MFILCTQSCLKHKSRQLSCLSFSPHSQELVCGHAIFSNLKIEKYVNGLAMKLPLDGNYHIKDKTTSLRICTGGEKGN